MFARENLQGRLVPTAGGLAIIVPGVLAATGGTRHGFLGAAIAVAGFGGLGLLDDLPGDRTGGGGARGIRGHWLRSSGAG